MSKLLSVSSSPLYHQLKQRIADDIEKGNYPVGSRIPPEHELENIYQVSRVTVRRALAELTADGFLERKQGKGTFVSEPSVNRDMKSIHSFHDSCRKSGKRAGTRVIRIAEKPADAADCAELGLSAGERVIETVRVWKADDIPVAVEINHFPMTYAYLENENLNGSLYQVLRQYGIEPDLATHEISLVFADNTNASLLDIQTGNPLICLREVVYDQKGRPLHNSVQLICGDRYTTHI